MNKNEKETQIPSKTSKEGKIKEQLEKLANSGNFYAKQQILYERLTKEGRNNYFNLWQFIPIAKRKCNHTKLLPNNRKISTIRAIATQYKAIFDNKTQKWHHFAIDERICIECGKTVEIKAKFIRATKSHHIMLE